MDPLEPGQGEARDAAESVGRTRIVIATPETPLRPIEVVAAHYEIFHALHATFYENSLMNDTNTDPNQITQSPTLPVDPSGPVATGTTGTSGVSDSAGTSPSNPWDGVPPLFSARNPKLPSQVYASRDNGVTWEAMRGPEQAGERESMAPLVDTPLADGTDYAPHFEQWHPGFVFLATDAALLAAVIAAPGTVISAGARDVSALKITPLDDAGDAGAAKAPPAPTDVHGDLPTGKPVALPAAAAPVTITADAHAKTASWISRLESRAVALGHAADGEFMAGIAALRRLLGHL
jgi:hypothetical protein